MTLSDIGALTVQREMGLRPRSLWLDAARRLLRNRVAVGPSHHVWSLLQC